MSLYELLAITFLTGFFVKLVDDIEDNKIKALKGIASAFAVIYGALIGFVIARFPDVAALWIAVPIAMLIAKKINNLPHVLGILTIITTLFLLKLPKINVVLVLVFIVAAYFDEILYEVATKIKKNIIQKVFSQRLLLELVALAVSIIANNYSYILAILFFDVGYKISELCTRKIILKKS